MNGSTLTTTLATESWRTFSPYLHPYQWAFDAPEKSPRAAEIASAILNRGKPGSHTFMRDNGWRYILRSLHCWAFEQAITKHRKLYYVSSGKVGLALPYFDIDLHHVWQCESDGRDAQHLVNELLPNCLFWSASSRGVNGYLKVDLHGESYQSANLTFERLEKAIRRFLAQHKNLADFELKGRIGYMERDQYRWACYGKLPIHSPDWSFARLEEFQNTATIPLCRLVALCDQIEAGIPQQVLDDHEDYKESLSNTPVVQDGYFLVTPAIQKTLVERHGEGWYYFYSDWRQDSQGIWLGQQYCRADGILTEQEARMAMPPPTVHAAQADAVPPTPNPATPAKQSKSPLKVNLDMGSTASEPDSFIRQRQALLELARYLKRVPDLDEAMAFIKDKKLYTGTWTDNLAKRKARVASTLKYIARSFDIAKSGHGSVNVGKYDRWAVDHFPHGLVHARSLKDMTPDGQVVATYQESHVGTTFIAAFMAICEFALLIDKNEDGTLPHERAEELWESLYQKGLISVKFNARKWAACREALAQHGIVRITNREYGPNKAMEWECGVYFPFLGLWKSKKQPSLLGPVKRHACLCTSNRHRQDIHNTLLQSYQSGIPPQHLWRLSHVPP